MATQKQTLVVLRRYEADASGWVRGLRQVETATKQTSAELNKLGGRFAAASAAVKSFGAGMLASVSFGAITAGFTQAAKAASDYSDDIEEAALSSGVTANSIEVLARKSIAFGGDVTTAGEAAFRMSVNLQKAATRGGPLSDMLSEIGLDAAELARNPTAAVEKLRGAFQKIDDEAQRAALAVALFKGNGELMLKTFLGIDKTMGDTAAEMIRLGQMYGPTARKQLQDYSDNWAELASTLEVLSARTMGPFVEQLAGVAKNLNLLLTADLNKARDWSALFDDWAESFEKISVGAAAGSAIGSLLGPLGMVAGAVAGGSGGANVVAISKGAETAAKAVEDSNAKIKKSNADAADSTEQTTKKIDDSYSNLDEKLAGYKLQPTVSFEGIAEENQAKLVGFLESTAKRGIELGVSSGFRSAQRQAEIYAAAANKSMVAKPGSSLHEKGMAVDIRTKSGVAPNTQQQQVIREEMDRWGLSDYFKKEDLDAYAGGFTHIHATFVDGEKKAQDAIAARNATMDEANATTERYRTAQQVLSDTTAKLNEQRAKGLIDEGTYNRAMDDAIDLFERTDEATLQRVESTKQLREETAKARDTFLELTAQLDPLMAAEMEYHEMQRDILESTTKLNLEIGVTEEMLMRAKVAFEKQVIAIKEAEGGIEAYNKAASDAVLNSAEYWIDSAVEGTLNWKDALIDMTKELVKLTAKYIIFKTVVSAFGLQGSGFSFGGFSTNAKGNPFAGGTGLPEIVTSPTFFKFAKGGNLGVAGEAGPEAIMPMRAGGIRALMGGREMALPLARTASGHLAVNLAGYAKPFAMGGVVGGTAGSGTTAGGINQNINITNQMSDTAAVETKTKDNGDIDIVIRKIENLISRGGNSTSRVFESAYRLSRAR